MTDHTVSVVIVSRDRAAALVRCLKGVAQLQYDGFEIIVVADPEGIKAAQTLPFADDLKLLPFDEPNISAARNEGLIHAAGDIVAFIDDDAVPEPQWLRYLIAPAARSDVAAMGGFVRGRNGIAFQWQARSLDHMGHAEPINVDPKHATVLTPPPGRGIKTEGTNMAIRRHVLISIGGFDPAYHYYLDETDVNMRLAQAGHNTAIVPLAEVHHGFAASRFRRPDRVPRDLFDIGASWAVFQRKHIQETAHKSHWLAIRKSERRRLLIHMIAGRLEPRDVRRLMQRLDLGYLEGTARPIERTSLPRHPAAPFKPFPATRRQSQFVAKRPRHAKDALAAAAKQVERGEIATVLILSNTALFHHLSFNEDGVWVQRGGLFGKSNRKGRLFRFMRFQKRAEIERSRVSLQRGC